MRNITNARNAVISTESNHDVLTMLSGKAPGRFLSHFYLVASVQIAMGRAWAGTYRVFGCLRHRLDSGKGRLCIQVAEM